MIKSIQHSRMNNIMKGVDEMQKMIDQFLKEGRINDEIYRSLNNVAHSNYKIIEILKVIIEKEDEKDESIPIINH